MNKLRFLILFFNCFWISAQTSSTVDSLHTLIKKSEPQKKANLILELASYYNDEKTRNIDSLRFYTEQILKINQTYLAPKQKIDALYFMGLAENYARNDKEAIQLMEQVLTESKKIDYAIGLRKANYELGVIYSKNEENLKGISYYEQAYEIARKHNESEDVILDLMVSLCLEYIRITDWTKTSEILEKTVAIIDKPSVPLSTKCHFHLNAALFYYDLENDEKSLSHFNTALKLAEQNNNKRLQSAALINIGNIYSSSRKSDYKKANTYFLRALKIIETDSILNNGSHKGNVLFYLGYNNYYDENYRKAISNLEEALPILKHSDELPYIYSIMFLGYSYKKVNQLRKSNNHFKIASSRFLKIIENLKKDGNPKNQIAKIYLNLSTIDSTQGNFKRSLAYHKLYTNYRDSINNETNIKITERFEFVKQNAEKDAEITKLSFENEQQTQKAELQKSQKKWLLFILILVTLFTGVVLYGFSEKKKGLKIINEKNEENKLLMKEIHHRVKNNLQIILSLLNAQIDGNQNNQKLKGVLTESLNKIKSMAIIHNSLYQSNQFTKVCANSYINELIHNLNKSFENKNEKIKFEVDVDKKQIKMGLAIPLGLIVNELITNSHKYAFNDNSKENNVIISFKQLDQSNRFELIIKDNGIGLPEDFNIDELSSFGIQLVQGLVHQLHGSIDIINQQGTKFEIYLEEPIAA